MILILLIMKIIEIIIINGINDDINKWNEEMIL